MTTEQDYLELAEDCKHRIESKSQEIKNLTKQNNAYIRALCEIKTCSTNLLLLHSILDEATKSTRVGHASNLMRRMNINLVDIDMAYQTLNDDESMEEEEMDLLSRFTIANLGE